MLLTFRKSFVFSVFIFNKSVPAELEKDLISNKIEELFIFKKRNFIKFIFSKIKRLEFNNIKGLLK